MKCLIGLIFIALVSGEASSLEKFTRANILYSENNYEEALKFYKALEDEGIESTSLYYNIGNSYYRLGEIGKAILYYKKALRLNPLDGDIKSNLKFVEEMTLDNIEVSTQNKIKSIGFFWYYIFNLKMLVGVAFIFSTFMWIVLILKIYKKSELLNCFFYLSFSMFILFGFGSFVKFWEHNIIKEGIIIAKEVNVRSSANDMGIVLFNLHEGVEVKIEDSLNNFYRIKLKDSKIGWIKKEFIGII